MIVKFTKSQPQKARLPDGSVQTGRLEFTTYKIASDSDMEELHEKIVEGIEFVSQVNVGNSTYVTVRKFQPLPFDLAGGSAKNLPQKGK